MSEPVYDVVELDIHWTLALPNGNPSLVIAALGRTRTSGWSNPRLDRQIYLNPPKDGIQEYMFQADPPPSSGPVSETLTHILAFEIRTTPSWAKGIRVKASQNAMEVII